jgi:Tfp pilus assembly protein PilF
VSKALRKIAPDEFARRLKGTTQEADKRFAFFLGAGCSVSSGVVDAAGLVRDEWLPRLRDLRAPKRADLDAWAKGEFVGWDPKKAAVFYGPVLEALFLQAEERQREIERLCDGKFPGFGYATLANLVTFEAGRFNVVLTTNFDDLVADALYLFTSARPLVIQHESLANYIRPTRTRPLVVKLHGDHRLSPQNTTAETRTLKEQIEAHVHTLLHDRGLIFMGYGGNDEGIATMLEALPAEALPLGVFWTSGREPKGRLRSWLETRDAIWIETERFDDLMLLIRDVFDLPHPERRRFEEVFEKYKATYDTLSGRIVALPDTAPDASVLKDAVKRTDESFPDWWAVEVAASRVENTDPDRADGIYRAGIGQFPTSAPLLHNYAIFLQTVPKDYEQAEAYFQKSLAVDRDNEFTLGNYALFLEKIRKDYEKAEIYYRKAVKAYMSNLNSVGNYAGFLLARNRREQGLALLDRVLRHPKLKNYETLPVECWFYAFAHRAADARSEALRNLRQVLEHGGRSPEWDLNGNIARAEADGHPDAAWLAKLASVISDGADLSTLQAWPEWNKAEGP